MSAEITVLDNGLRVVTQSMAHLETTSLGLWVGVGARHESPAEHGISHLIEHMSFKGTAKRSARVIAEEIEAVGGELNAATGLEMTSYFARVLKGDEGVAVELLADILLNSRFAPEELDREREVILQEIAAVRDSPDDIAYELAHEAAWPGQSVGRSILGTPGNIRGFEAADLRRFLEGHYGAENMVLSAAGAVRHETMVRHAEALFGGLTGPRFEAAQSARYEGGTRWHAKRFEQAHMVLAFEAPSYRDRDFFAAQVFSGLFGGGMSSRLFQEVRETRGLCYAIYSSAWGLKDTGMFAIHAATGAETMAELVDVVATELERMGREGAAADEIGRAKAQLKAGLLMGLESSSARAEQMARQLLGYGRLIPTEELMAGVDAVSAESVRNFARRLAAARPSVAIVGAGKRSAEFAKFAERRLVPSAVEGVTWRS